MAKMATNLHGYEHRWSIAMLSLSFSTGRRFSSLWSQRKQANPTGYRWGSYQLSVDVGPPESHTTIGRKVPNIPAKWLNFLVQSSHLGHQGRPWCLELVIDFLANRWIFLQARQDHPNFLAIPSIFFLGLVGPPQFFCSPVKFFLGPVGPPQFSCQAIDFVFKCQ